jgi:hypothetical protein
MLADSVKVSRQTRSSPYRMWEPFQGRARVQDRFGALCWSSMWTRLWRIVTHWPALGEPHHVQPNQPKQNSSFKTAPALARSASSLSKRRASEWGGCGTNRTGASAVALDMPSQMIVLLFGLRGRVWLLKLKFLSLSEREPCFDTNWQ